MALIRTKLPELFKHLHLAGAKGIFSGPPRKGYDLYHDYDLGSMMQYASHVRSTMVSSAWGSNGVFDP